MKIKSQLTIHSSSHTHSLPSSQKSTLPTCHQNLKQIKSKEIKIDNKPKLPPNIQI